MEIPINLDDEIAITRFLDCLELALNDQNQRDASMHVRSDGTYEYTFYTDFVQGEAAWKLVWKLRMTEEGKLLPLVVNPDVPIPSGNWEAHATQAVASALASTINPDKESVFTRYAFAYQESQNLTLVGPLDGEYFLPGLRISPASKPGLNGTEQIMLMDFETKGVSKKNAKAVSELKAKRHSALLSLFLDIGLYEANVGGVRWTVEYNSPEKRESKCSALGYVDMEDIPTSMPEKGTLRKAGSFSPVDRSKPQGMESVSATPYFLKVPADIRRLLRGVEALPEPEKKVFYSAAILFQIGQNQDRRAPSLRIAFKVAAVDCLNPGGQKNLAGFKTLMKQFCPQVEEEFVSWMYGRVRSGLFHAGSFSLKEFEAVSSGPLFMRKLLDVANYEAYSHSVIRHCLIGWLLAKTPEDKEKDAP